MPRTNGEWRRTLISPLRRCCPGKSSGSVSLAGCGSSLSSFSFVPCRPQFMESRPPKRTDCSALCGQQQSLDRSSSSCGPAGTTRPAWHWTPAECRVGHLVWPSHQPLTCHTPPSNKNGRDPARCSLWSLLTVAGDITHGGRAIITHSSRRLLLHHEAFLGLVSLACCFLGVCAIGSHSGGTFETDLTVVLRSDDLVSRKSFPASSTSGFASSQVGTSL